MNHKKINQQKKWELFLISKLLIISAVFLPNILKAQDCITSNLDNPSNNIYFKECNTEAEIINTTGLYPDNANSNTYNLTGYGESVMLLEQNCMYESKNHLDNVTTTSRLYYNFGCSSSNETDHCFYTHTASNINSLVISGIELKFGQSGGFFVELYNGSNSNINFTTNNYKLIIYEPGSNNIYIEIPFDGTMGTSSTTTCNVNQTFVLCTDASPLNIQLKADLIIPDVNIPGDHTIHLVDGIGNVKDVFGNLGCDPGDEWSLGNDATLSMDNQDQLSRKNKAGYTVDTNGSEPVMGCEFIQDITSGFSFTWSKQPFQSSSFLGEFPQSLKYPLVNNGQITHPNSSSNYLGSNRDGIAPRVNIYNKANDGIGLITANSISGIENILCGADVGVYISTHSWGDARNDVNDGSYKNRAKGIDQIIYENPYHVLFKSSGNEGNPSSGLGNAPDKLLGSTPAAKNIITVGNAYKFDLTTADYDHINGEVMLDFCLKGDLACSVGPTDDFRIKPDIISSGTETSWSTPTAAGAAALLKEQWSNYFPSPNIPLAATMKALMIHTAVPLASYNTTTGTSEVVPTPNYKTGWGLLDVQSAAELIDDASTTGNGEATIKELNYSGNDIYFEVAASGLQDLRATIVWTDVPGIENTATVAQGINDGTANLLDGQAQSVLVNDLDIEIIDAGGNPTLPWTLDINNPLGSPVQAVDNLNNVERVTIEQTDISSNQVFLVRITGKGDMLDDDGNIASQNFSLIISGGSIELNNPVGCLPEEEINLYFDSDLTTIPDPANPTGSGIPRGIIIATNTLIGTPGVTYEWEITDDNGNEVVPILTNDGLTANIDNIDTGIFNVCVTIRFSNCEYSLCENIALEYQTGDYSCFADNPADHQISYSVSGNIINVDPIPDHYYIDNVVHWTLTNGNGNQIDFQTQDNANQTVSFTIPSSGTYYLNMSVMSVYDSDCDFDVFELISYSDCFADNQHDHEFSFSTTSNSVTANSIPGYYYNNHQITWKIIDVATNTVLSEEVQETPNEVITFGSLTPGTYQLYIEVQHNTNIDCNFHDYLDPFTVTACTGCNCRKMNPTEKMLQQSLSKMISEELKNNFVKAQYAFIKHQDEILKLIESDKKVVGLFEKIKEVGYEMLIHSLVYRKEVFIKKDHYVLITEFLEAISSATKTGELKSSIEEIQKYLYVIVDKEVKQAIIDFDRAKEKVGPRKYADFSETEVSILTNNSDNTTLIFRSECLEGTLSLTIYDVQGKKVSGLLNNKNINDGQLKFDFNTSKLTSGIYMANVYYKANGCEHSEAIKFAIF